MKDITVNELLSVHGFGISDSGGGCKWATKEEDDGKTFTAITDDGGLDIPKTIHDTIMVGTYYVDSGDCISCEEWVSLREYFLGCRCGENLCLSI